MTAKKQMILHEIKQSNGIKPQKINFSCFFCKFLPHKGNFCWKVPSKLIYSFYLKHQKYPFCAPIFNPLLETESYVFTYFLDIKIKKVRYFHIEFINNVRRWGSGNTTLNALHWRSRPSEFYSAILKRLSWPQLWEHVV